MFTENAPESLEEEDLELGDIGTAEKRRRFAEVMADAEKGERKNILSVYIRDTTRYARLTPTEEMAYGKVLMDLRPMTRAISYLKKHLGRLPTDADLAEETGLRLSDVQKIKSKGAKAREQLILSHLRLVIKLALRYRDYGLPLLDLINEGNIGLIQSIDRYNPSRGVKLSTFASFEIKQRMRSALSMQAKTISLPISRRTLLQKIVQIEQDLEKELGRTPTNEEVSKILGKPTQMIFAIKAAGVAALSLDMPINEDSDAPSIGERMGDKAPNALDNATSSSVVEEIEIMLGMIDPRQAQVLRMRFGMNGSSETTLAEIGRVLNVTRERARQIEADALKELRKVSELRRLETASKIATL